MARFVKPIGVTKHSNSNNSMLIWIIAGVVMFIVILFAISSGKARSAASKQVLIQKRQEATQLKVGRNITIAIMQVQWII